jgi:hypothetical protein
MALNRWQHPYEVPMCIAEGATVKVSQGCQTQCTTKTFCFNEQKCIFEHYRKVKAINNNSNCNFFNDYIYLFRGPLHKHIFVIHKDALFLKDLDSYHQV